MALNYLSGRVSRFGVGVPGFSTSGDLTLAVSGAVGVETTKPRAEVDTPNISIRGNIVDSSVAIGSIGYFLSRDENGVRWRASDPANLAFITVYDDGDQVGLGDFGGLNFKASNDETFITITPNPGNPEIADINYDVRWLRFDYGANKAIATAFGPDGTYASIPGYGTSEAVGVTSIGIGTIQPQDDFQVGIGSTGVTINGALGKVEAEIVKADEIEVDGNLTVESLIVRPGIATIAFLEVENDAKIPIEYVGFSSIQEADIVQLNADNILAGLTTLGVGGEDVFVLNDLFVQGGIGTFDGDVFVAGDLSVGGELFVEQLNAENILITGIATVVTGIFTSVNTEEIFATGVSTFNEIQYNVGFGTTSNVRDLFVVDAEIDNAVITDQRVTGVATISTADIDRGFLRFGSIDDAIVGVATADLVYVNTDLLVGGATTLLGIVTTGGDAYIGSDLYVGGETFFKQINAVNLDVSGVATIFQGISTDFSVSGLLTATDFIAGFATITEVDIGGGNVGGIDFPGTGDIEGNDLDFDTGRIGILTGDVLAYGIGTITQFDSGLGTITTLRGEQLFYSETSQINNVTFFDDRLQVDQNLNVVGAAITLGDVATDPKVGLTTIAGDGYIGNDLYVGGEQFIKQLNATNLSVTGVATINNQLNIGITSITTGIASDLFVELLQFDDAIGSAATITKVSGDDLNFEGNASFISGLQSKFLSVIRSPGGSDFEGTLQAVNILVGEDVGISSNLIVAGITTLNIVDIEEATVSVSTVTDLSVTGVATISGVTIDNNNINVPGISTVVGFSTFGDSISVKDDVVLGRNFLAPGISTFRDIRVSGAATFEGLVDIQDIALINQEITGVASISTLRFNAGFGTFLDVESSITGVASVGLASIRNIEATEVIAYQQLVDRSLLGIASIGVDSTTPALYINGITSITGFTTFAGDAYIDGDLTVSGITTFAQLDAEQSQIGILTVFTLLQSQQITELNQVSIAGSFVASGVSTIGLSTFSADGDLTVNRDLVVGGDTTFLGIVTITETSFVNQEVTGISSVNQLKFNVGVGTELTVERLDAGIATARDLTVTGITTVDDLTISGITTFEGSLDINADITIDADIQMTGIITATTLDIVYSRVGVQTVGIQSVGQLRVVGLSTFESDVDINADANIQTATIGVATVGFLTATDGYVGVLTSVNGFFETVAVGSTTTIPDGTSGITSNLITSQDGYFTGILTATAGIFTTANIENVDIGIATVGFLTATDGYVGVLTSVNGFFETIAIGSTTTIPDGTSGITSNLITSQDGYFTGILTATTGIFTSVTTEDLVVTGLSTLGFTTISTGSTTSSALVVTGLSTFSGVTTFIGDVFVDGDLNVTGVTSFEQLDAGQSRIGILTVFETLDNLGDLQVTGVTTLGLTTVTTDLFVGNSLDVTGDIFARSNVTIEENLIVNGTSEFNDFVGINSNLVVDGFTQTEELNVLGVGTISQAIITNAEVGLSTIGFATITDAYIGVSTVGFATLGVATDQSALFVTGISTLNGFVNFTENVLIEGELQVIGLTTFNDLGAKRAQIGILTVAEYMTIADIDQQPTGFSTLANISFLDADGLNLGIAGLTTTTDLSVSGFATITNDLRVNGDTDLNGDLDLDGNLDVSGITSLGAPGPTGFTTIRGDLYVDGNLYVLDDIFKDEITGRNAFISGVATINNLFVNSGVATNFITTSFQAVTGVITDLSVNTIDADIGEIDDLIVDFFEVTGVATLGNSSPSGFTTTRGDLFVAGDFSVLGDGEFAGDLTANNIEAANQIKGNTGIFTTGTIELLNVTSQLNAANLAVAGFGTIPILEANQLEVGIVTVTSTISAGFATVTDIYVENSTNTDFLNVRTTSLFNDLATFTEDILVTGSTTSGNVLVSGVTTSNNLNVLGIATITAANVTGIATINALTGNTAELITLAAQDVRISNSLRANIGIITNLTYEVGVADTLSVNTQLLSNQSQLSGITTISDLRAEQATIQNLNVTGIATAADLNILSGSVNVGLATVQELNFEDIITNRATRVTTSAIAPVTLITLDTSTQSAEFSITVQTGTDVQSTKINVAIDGSTKAWNEYSTVFTNTELATFDVVDSLGETVLLATPNSASLTRFTTYSVSHNS